MKQNQRGVVSTLFILIIVGLVGTVVFFVFQSSQLKQGSPLNQSTPALLNDEEAIINLFEDSMVDWPLLGQNEEFRVEGVEKQGEWAFIRAALVDSRSGELFVGELTIFLFRMVNNEWEIAFPGSDTYKDWLEEFPETLLPADIKRFLF